MSGINVTHAIMAAHVYYVVSKMSLFYDVFQRSSQIIEKRCVVVLPLHSEFFCCIILPNIKLIFWKDIGDIEEEKGGARHSTHFHTSSKSNHF